MVLYNQVEKCFELVVRPILKHIRVKCFALRK